MALGMTYDQYWYGDPLMVRAFYKADKLRRDREDETAWLLGLYVRSALDSVVGNAFRQKGTQPAEYPPEPMSAQRRREEQEAKGERDKEREALWAKAWMSSLVQAGKNWGKER